MQIVHITTIDEGGAYKAVVRMQEALRLVDIDSKILLRNKLHKKNEGEIYLDNPIKSLISKGKNFFNLLLSEQEIVYEGFGSNVLTHPTIKNADIIVIHWCNSFLSYKSIKKLLNSGKKIIFFMHDTWLFTGGCHVNLGCEKYETGCGSCPYINGEKERDLSYWNYRAKKELFDMCSVQIVGPSRWIVDCATHSNIINKQKIIYIPNCINVDVFRRMEDIEEIRYKYEIPSHKKVILFGAAFNGIENKNKGFGYLLKALEHLDTEEYYLVIFGKCSDADVIWEHKYKLLGYIHSEQEMAEIYNLADVYVTPSLQESFGFTVCEAMACGTSVAAFNIGGISEQIEHKKNGYLAKLCDSKDLAEGIEYCVQHSEELGVEAQKRAQLFSYENVGKQYYELINRFNDRRDKKEM